MRCCYRQPLMNQARSELSTKSYSFTTPGCGYFQNHSFIVLKILGRYKKWVY